ncbi:MAG: peptidylprolyl isomerase [Propionibacteriaceae bacterium]
MRLRPPLLVVPAALLAMILTGCGQDLPGNRSAAAHPTSTAAQCEYTATGTAAKPVDPPPTTGVAMTGTTEVTLQTDQGDVTMTLDSNRAPCTVNSFLSLAQQGFYTDTSCHRLIDNGTGVLQCGDPTGTGAGGPGYSFPDELRGDEAYGPGVVAMANAGPNTNGSQFFMVYEDFPIRAKDYTVFATLDEASRAVVAKIGSEGHDGSGSDGSGRPKDPAQITAVTVG